MKFSDSIVNLLLFGLVVGFAFVIIAIIGTTEIAQQFELVISSSYSSKIPVLVFFVSGVGGLYASVFRLWRNPNSQSNALALGLYGVMLIAASVLLVVWSLGVYDLVKMEFDLITFPTDVDEVMTKVRLSLLSTVIWMFVVFAAMGAVSLIAVLIHIKSISRRDF